MKTKFILPLIAIVLLSSCSSKFSLQKRRYSKGFYFDLSSNHSSEKKNNLRPAAHLDAKKAELAIGTNDQELSLKVVEQSEPTIKLASVEKVSANKSKNAIAASGINSDKAEASIQKIQTETKTFRALPIAAIKGKEARKAKTDNNKILLIILSLFPILALIAIYLHDGKTITLNFWIDLILHFLFLYWLFALLVVLDVINLA
jgi:glucan-binding YG repeat protein